MEDTKTGNIKSLFITHEWAKCKAKNHTVFTNKDTVESGLVDFTGELDERQGIHTGCFTMKHAISDQGSGLGIYLSGKVLAYYLMGPRCNF